MGFFVSNKCFESNNAGSSKIFTQQSEIWTLCLLDATLKLNDLTKMPQCWREALASELGWTVLWSGCLHPHVSWDKAVTSPPLLRKTIQDKPFLSRPKSLLFQAIWEIPFQPYQAASSHLDMGSRAGHYKVSEAVAATRQTEILPGITWWFRRSAGNISDTQNLSSLSFCFWFYFKLFISCMISISIATFTPLCSGPFSGANVNWYRLSQVQTLTPQGKKGQRVATSKLSIAPDLCRLLNFAGYPNADSLGQKHVKSCVSNLPKWVGVFPGQYFLGIHSWQGHVSNGLGRAYSKRPNKLFPNWHYIPARTWSAANKTRLKQFAHPVLRAWQGVFQRLSKGSLISPALLIFAGQTLLTYLKPRGRLHIYWQKSAFSLIVSCTEGNYDKDWWKSFNSYCGDSIMTARLKMSFINHHRAREHDNEWVNYTSIWGWYYPSAALIN